MKTVTGALETHLAGEATTLATCWQITRRDGVVMRFTDHDADLVLDGATYLSAVGYEATAIESTSGMSVDNLDADVLLDSAGITEADLIAGRYDFAAVEIRLCNWAAPATGSILLRRGTLGEVSLRNGRARVELRGLAQALQQTVGRVFARRCDADLGDARCGVALVAHTVTGTVSSVTTAREVFVVSSAPLRADGVLTWTSGVNAGLQMEVRAVSGSTLSLALPMPYDIAAGDGYSVYSGCDKNLSTCRDVFANVANFRGFPHIPGQDKVLAYPDAH